MHFQTWYIAEHVAKFGRILFIDISVEWRKQKNFSNVRRL